MNALRKLVEDQHAMIERPAPVLVTIDPAPADPAPAASPARVLQLRLEEATLRSFYAAVPARRIAPFTAGALRIAGAIGGGLLLWAGVLVLATRNLA